MFKKKSSMKAAFSAAMASFLFCLCLGNITFADSVRKMMLKNDVEVTITEKRLEDHKILATYRFFNPTPVRHEVNVVSQSQNEYFWRSEIAVAVPIDILGHSTILNPGESFEVSGVIVPSPSTGITGRRAICK